MKNKEINNNNENTLNKNENENEVIIKNNNNINNIIITNNNNSNNVDNNSININNNRNNINNNSTNINNNSNIINNNSNIINNNSININNNNTNNNSEKSKNKNENLKYGEKINAKKKQLSKNTVFNRLYNNKKKKENEKDKEKETTIKKFDKNNNNNKTYKMNKEQQMIYNKNNNNKKNIGSFIIIENNTTTTTTNTEENTNIKKNNNLRQNNHFPLINDLKKESKINPSKNQKKESTNESFFNSNSFIQKLLEESKNSEKSKKIEQFKHPIIFDDSEYETYSFKPEINQKSIDLCKKKIKKKRKDSSPLNKTDTNIAERYIEKKRRMNTSVADSLYEDAWNKKQKMENLYEKEKSNIKKDVNKSLISKGSNNLLIKKNNLKLNEIIEKYSNKNNGKLSIVHTIQCLWEIHILQELLKNVRNVENIDFEYIKNIIEEIINKTKNNNRKIEEIEFVEQLWIKINPYYKNENDFIEKDTLYKFLKILFSLNEQTEINKLIVIIQTFLIQINKKENKNIENNEINKNEENNENENEKEKENNVNDENEKKDENEDNNENEIITKEKNNDKNNDKNKKYVSLLRTKEYSIKEIWSISKFIRVFFELKKMMNNYSTSRKSKIMEEIIKEREKELTFQPDFNATASYFKRNNKGDDSEDILNKTINSNTTKNSNKKRHDFNKLYEEFMLKKRMHEQALMILRENKQRREIKMCTDRPKINKHFKIKNRRKTPEVGCTRNEFLYKLNKDIMDRRKKKIEEDNDIIMKKYPFRKNVTVDENKVNKIFTESQKIKPRGTEEYIKRNRSLIQLRIREKSNEQKKLQCSNYEKIINQKINLPKIKDLEPSTNLLQKNEIERKESKKENAESNNNEDNDVYFTIQVKTAKGRIKPLKIYINNNPIEKANNFCDANNIKKATRDKIIQKIQELQKIYKEIGEDKKDNNIGK